MSWQPRASLRVIRERARIYRQIRSFFNQRGYLEVDTPLLMPSSNPDPHIDSLSLATDGRLHVAVLGHHEGALAAQLHE